MPQSKMDVRDGSVSLGSHRYPGIGCRNRYAGSLAMMPRKFTDEDIDRANGLRGRGEKWVVIEAMIGEGIKGACYYRDQAGYVAECSDERETRMAAAAWNGIGDRQSFIDGWKLRAKRERSFT
jgi:hypothetical protein